MSITIYGMGPSRSFRALWAAQEAEIDFEYISVDFGSKAEGGAQSDTYKKLNPQGKVPTLIHNDLVITESGAILNYLAHQAADKSLMPADGSADRVRYDQMCFFVLTELEQPLWTTGKHRFAIPEQYRIPEIIEKTAPFEFAKAQDALLHLKADREFAIGDSFTMADILLAQTLAWAQNFKFQVNSDLLAYKDRMFAREACLRAKAQIKN